MKIRDSNESILRGEEVYDADLRPSDKIQQQRDADVLDIVAQWQAVMEKEIVAPGSSDGEFVSSPESWPVKPRIQRKAVKPRIQRKARFVI